MVPWDASRETWCVEAACWACRGSRVEWGSDLWIPAACCRRPPDNAPAQAPILRRRDEESAQRMANIMHRFDAADKDGCAGSWRQLAVGAVGAVLAVCCAPGAQADAWLQRSPRARRGPSSALISTHPPTHRLPACPPVPHSTSTPLRSNGVIDREELRALLEHVGGGTDAVPMVRVFF